MEYTLQWKMNGLELHILVQLKGSENMYYIIL